ncbi:MAG TPA: DUF4870 domain-containing protein [Acidimicrobiales bacterium]|nr:DUF4870 domain-containing protein [Acidimicrobiales bacterium]
MALPRTHGTDWTVAAERVCASTAHLTIFLAAMEPLIPVGGLVVLALMRVTVGRSPGLVRDNITRAFNYQVFAWIVCAALYVSGTWALEVVGGVLGVLFAAAATMVVLGLLLLPIVAALHASKAEEFEYPASLRILR